MARVKEAAAEALTAVEEQSVAQTGRAESTESDAATAPEKLARLPGPAQFVLAVALSFGISSLGRLSVDYLTPGELAYIARPPSSRTEEAIIAGWKLLGLALGWLAEFDGYDLASLALLSHGPATFLVSVFYGIRWLTAGAYLGVEVVSASLPFLLLRHLSGAHSAKQTPNREIVADRFIQVLTSLQAGLVYSVVLFMAGRTFLPTTFVLHFDGIPTIKPAVDAVFLGFGGLPTGILSLLFGLAARSFIFAPFITAPQTLEDQEMAKFDPASATLGQTVAWNLWGYTTKTKVSIIRTAVAMVFTAVGTYVDTALSIKGVDSCGAVVYASVWVLAALLTGCILTYVGNI
ncbi:hypothetical protein B0T21DRAFT_407167 [Apiosordaria backusii]|uniref:Uncharacterized protein n=1 Tax=Apiosordaria backusii TaxID=314023 RepID=A0AA40EZY5_9PEZI|nr:hypothetical protein B0T21DRAFT_407167 [Apiosordaria backusii]